MHLMTPSYQRRVEFQAVAEMPYMGIEELTQDLTILRVAEL